MAFQFIRIKDKNSSAEEFLHFTFPAIAEIANIFPKERIFKSEDLKIAVTKVEKLFESKIEKERTSRRTIKPTTRMVKMAKKEIKRIISSHTYKVVISDKLTILSITTE